MQSPVAREQLVEVFGAENLIVIPDSVLPLGITDRFTRDFLSTVGLPREISNHLLELDERLGEQVRTLREAPTRAEYGYDLVEGTEDYFYLGDLLPAGQIALDGATGRLYSIREADILDFLNTDVARFAYFMMVLERDKNLFGSDHCDAAGDEEALSRYEQAADQVRAAFVAVDRAAAEPDTGLWPWALDGIAAGDPEWSEMVPQEGAYS